MTYYHEDPLPPLPAAVHGLRLKKREGGEGVRVWVDDVAGLLGLVELGVVEVDPWNAMVENIELAEAMAFDLDPARQRTQLRTRRLLIRVARESSRSQTVACTAK
jgi:DNA primase